MKNTILDYSVEIVPLEEKDKSFSWPFVSHHISNYSLTGFELQLQRNIFKYIITYYFPSGLFVIVSWVIVILFWYSYIQYVFILVFFQVSFLIPPETKG
jgi:hypothetical protein